MEKIYMEENQNNNNRRGGRSSTSVMMSFILAFVAIISLVAYGFGQISFAIDPEGEIAGQFPDTIDMVGEGSQAYAIFAFDPNLPGAITESRVALHRYAENPDKFIYCVEQDNTNTADGTYTKGTEIEDSGLVFLLSYLLNENYAIKSTSANNADVGSITPLLRPWITQSAIWIYQKEIGAEYTEDMTEDMKDAILSAVALTDGDHPNSAAVYNSNHVIYDDCYIDTPDLHEKTIRQILEKALAIHRGQDFWNFGIKITKNSDTVSLTTDEKYYQSDKITVSASGFGFKGYKVDLSACPEGTYLVDADNNKIEDSRLDNITVGTQFYVRVPIDKITEDNKTIRLKVTGAYEIPIAYRYFRSGYQTVALIGNAVKHYNTGIDIPFEYTPEVPDTSITTAQSIYFVGLLILLTGVGIIYSNVKPSKAN